MVCFIAPTQKRPHLPDHVLSVSQDCLSVLNKFLPAFPSAGGGLRDELFFPPPQIMTPTVFTETFGSLEILL